MKIKNLLAGGCSFTTNGIGGVPPMGTFTGGCSFRDGTHHQAAECATWASFLSQWLEVDSFVNLASGGHGLTLLRDTIIDAIERYDYNPNNTMVVFNVSSHDRLDIKIPWDDNNTSSRFIPWDSTVLDYTYAEIQGELWHKKFKQMELEDLVHMNQAALQTLFEYLDQHQYRWVFVMMRNYLDNPLIKQHQHNLVDLSPGSGMYEFCRDQQLLSADNFHPSQAGYRVIAQHVYDHIKTQHCG